VAEGTWICCQLGAREHYAVPRALHAKGRLELLVTDLWIAPRYAQSRFLAAALGRRLGGRYHPQLRDARIEHLDFSALWFELISTLVPRRGWDQIMARNRHFQLRTIKRLQQIKNDGKPRTLFAYSYAANEILRYARDRGWRTVLGQIDPGPVHERIVAEEVAREPQFAMAWEPAPAQYWTLWREECELSDRIMVNSEWSREALHEAGIGEEKVCVVPLAFQSENPVQRPEKIYPAQFTTERKLKVLFLGQVSPGKGIARLLKAADALRAEPIEFWIIGPAPRKDMESIDARRNVRWMGTVTRDRAGAYYDAGDLFILPTLSDGFAMTQLEAVAHGLPIIASRRCGEVVRHGINGLLLDEATPTAIEAALRVCLRNPDRLSAFAREAKLDEEFSIASLGKRLLSLGKSVP
jgi:glycosyltransferase involved in cell wall biosynthesis